MLLRPSIADLSFDEATFQRLRADLSSGLLREPKRLQNAPIALSLGDSETIGALPTQANPRQTLRERGQHAIRAGRVASLVLNGGMATRFGGGAKGAVAVVDGSAETFLSLKLGQCNRIARELGGRVPVVVMNSFATRHTSLRHLDEIDWGGLPTDDRFHFDQSIMPRLAADGSALVHTHAELPDADLYAAPGHGDTVGRFRQSGTLEKLRARGVDTVLVSNVDNLGATIDPLVVGAVLQAKRDVVVEVVRRREGDAGGCVAKVDGRPMIIEAFRLPEGLDLADYPHFNTNTLWFSLDALTRDYPLTWFPVRKQLQTASGELLPVIQLERLIGQVTEFSSSSYLEVDRDERFLPVKTRAELAQRAPKMRELIASVHD